MGDIDWAHLFFQFDGRINRAKFWLGVVGIWVIEAIAALIFDTGSFILLVVVLALLWPTLAIYTKRWHDRDKSGWWSLIILIPIIGFFWILIELGMLEGTKGPNQYGPDPLRDERLEGMGGGMSGDMDA